ncbi:MAG: hypothetical protein LBE57_04775 [Methanosarcinales archaeon]|jgi:hypothetical protein|nr:hypothetical protein [Methanosarcinales archaeon]
MFKYALLQATLSVVVCIWVALSYSGLPHPSRVWFVISVVILATLAFMQSVLVIAGWLVERGYVSENPFPFIRDAADGSFWSDVGLCFVTFVISLCIIPLFAAIFSGFCALALISDLLQLHSFNIDLSIVGMLYAYLFLLICTSFLSFCLMDGLIGGVGSGA